MTTATKSPVLEEEVTRFIERSGNFLDAHNIWDFFKTLLQELAVSRPVDPIQFLIDKLRRPKIGRFVVCAPPGMRPQAYLDHIHEKTSCVVVSAKQVVPDADTAELKTVVEAIAKRLNSSDCVEKGWLLHGFPRSRIEAQLLMDHGCVPSHVLALESEEDPSSSSDNANNDESSEQAAQQLPVFAFHVADVDADSDEDQEPPASTSLAPAAAAAGRAPTSRTETNDNEPGSASATEDYERALNQIAHLFQARLHFVDVGGEQDAARERISAVLDQVPPSDGLKRPPRVVVVGHAACGRTTQSVLLADRLGLVRVNPADLLRNHIDQQTDFGRKAQALVAQQDDTALAVVPDELVIDIIKERVTQSDCVDNGFVLDGFPRSVAQAGLLTLAGLRPTRVIVLHTPRTEAEARLAKRKAERKSDFIQTASDLSAQEMEASLIGEEFPDCCQSHDSSGSKITLFEQLFHFVHAPLR